MPYTQVSVNQNTRCVRKFDCETHSFIFQMDAAERAFHNLGMKPTPDNVAAEATRKAAVSFIIKRIQVSGTNTSMLG